MTDIVRGHRHLVTQTADGKFVIGLPVDALHARVPSYGEIQFYDRSGNKKEEGVDIVGLCDVDARRVAAAAKERKCATFGDYRKLLEDTNVDAVVITTPDHWHAIQAIHACQAGKDVFCDKPLSLTVREGRAMVEAARRYNTIFQVGPQQRSIPAANARNVHRASKSFRGLS